MRAIRLPWKVASELRHFVDAEMEVVNPDRGRLLAELDAALKPKRSVRAAKVRRVAKQKTRKERKEFRAAADNYFHILSQPTIDPGWVASRRACLATAALRLYLLEQGRRSKR